MAKKHMRRCSPQESLGTCTSKSQRDYASNLRKTEGKVEGISLDMAIETLSCCHWEHKIVQFPCSLRHWQAAYNNHLWKTAQLFLTGSR
jgi:hypothetical protein